VVKATNGKSDYFMAFLLDQFQQKISLQRQRDQAPLEMKRNISYGHCAKIFSCIVTKQTLILLSPDQK